MSDGGEKQELDGPFVVQCKSCRTIVCDSWSFVSASQERATLTVSKASNVSITSRGLAVDDKHDNSRATPAVAGQEEVAGGGRPSAVPANDTKERESPNTGSTFRVLCCSHCGAVLGRVYHATPRQLDGERGLFTFDHHAISSYRLGAHEFDAAAGDSDGAISLAEAGKVQEDLVSMKGDLQALKQLMLVFNERIQAIELTNNTVPSATFSS